MNKYHQAGAAGPLASDSESDAAPGRPGDTLWRPVEVSSNATRDLALQAQADAASVAPGGDLPPDELDFLARYRALGTVPRLAIRRYLTADDDRLVVAIYLQRFLGVRPR
jgi:hypothetical protein